MTRLPRVDGKKLVAVLKRAGFQVVRVRGSHHFLRHDDDGRVVVVPVHGREILGPGLLTRILADAKLSPEDLSSLL